MSQDSPLCCQDTVESIALMVTVVSNGFPIRYTKAQFRGALQFGHRIPHKFKAFVGISISKRPLKTYTSYIQTYQIRGN